MEKSFEGLLWINRLVVLAAAVSRVASIARFSMASVLALLGPAAYLSRLADKGAKH
jgi:hypothetical protein